MLPSVAVNIGFTLTITVEHDESNSLELIGQARAKRKIS